MNIYIAHIFRRLLFLNTLIFRMVVFFQDNNRRHDDEVVFIKRLFEKYEETNKMNTNKIRITYSHAGPPIKSQV